MKRARLAVSAAAFLVFAWAGHANAQQYRFDFGLKGGFSWMSAMLNEGQLGTDEASVRFKPGWRAGADATLWLSNRFGVRANFGYTDREVKQADAVLANAINLWDGTGDLIIRLTSVPDAFDGTQFLPYLALGAGAKWINPAENTGVNNSDVSGAVLNPVTTNNTGPYFLEHKTKFQVLAGIGALVRVSRAFGISLEAGDRIWDAPVDLLIPSAGGFSAFPPGNEDVGNHVNEIYGEVGLHALFGVKEAAPQVVVAPPPPPEAPAPPPPPAPTERDISVCVVDPTTATGTRMVDATLVIASNDTLVTVNGERQPLSSTVTGVMLAPQADWYVAGQPLAFTSNRRRVEFVTYGVPRTIDADQVVLIGTVNGLPVYAATQDLDSADQWRQVVGAATDRDLVTLLKNNPNLRPSFEKLQLAYVPVASTGCVFQGLQRVEEVRKSRGEEQR